jgi:hypothetical protein
MDVCRRPVELDANIVFRFDRSSCSLIEPKTGMFIVNHATDQPTFMPHCPIRGKAKAINPKTQAFLQVGTGNYRHT